MSISGPIGPETPPNRPEPPDIFLWGFGGPKIFLWAFAEPPPAPARVHTWVLATVGKETLLEDVSRDNIKDVITMVLPLVTVAKKADRTLLGQHWDMGRCDEAPGGKTSRLPLKRELKVHQREELADLELLHII